MVATNSWFLCLSIRESCAKNREQAGKTNPLVGDLIQNKGKNSAPKRPSAWMSRTNELEKECHGKSWEGKDTSSTV